MATGDVFLVDPPREVQQQFVERPLQEQRVALTTRTGHLVDAPTCPGMHRRVDVVKRKLVCRNLAVRRHVPLTQQQQQLVLSEPRVNRRIRDHVKGQIPSGVPRVLPLVRHRHDVAIVEVREVRIAAILTVARRLRLRGVPFQPTAYVIPIELSRPDQPGIRPGVGCALLPDCCARRSLPRRSHSLRHDAHR